MNGWSRWGTCGALLGLLGCGGADATSPNAAGGAAPQVGGASQGGGSNSNQGGSGGGSAGGAAAAGTSQGLPRAPDCSGTFGIPELALPGEPDVLLGSPTLSPDELELIYARKPRGQFEFRRSVRKSTDAVFPIGSPIPALDAACRAEEDRSVDLSRDGLRAYVACYSATSPVGPAILHVAERPAIGADFTFLPGTSVIGPSAAISADELTLYSASDIDPGEGPARQFTRDALGQPFANALDIPGLETLSLAAPDPAPDGLALYAGLDGVIAQSTRPSVAAPFSAPTTLTVSETATGLLGAPEMSQDCRSLYYLSQSSDTVTFVTTSQLLVLRR